MLYLVCFGTWSVDLLFKLPEWFPCCSSLFYCSVVFDGLTVSETFKIRVHWMTIRIVKLKNFW